MKTRVTRFLIDKDVKEAFKQFGSSKEFRTTNEIIDSVKGVDVESVVYCFQCKHQKHDAVDDRYYCGHEDGLSSYCVDDRDFCSRGKKHENGG